MKNNVSSFPEHNGNCRPAGPSVHGFWQRHADASIHAHAALSATLTNPSPTPTGSGRPTPTGTTNEGRQRDRSDNWEHKVR
jgi:hypothetical protein